MSSPSTSRPSVSPALAYEVPSSTTVDSPLTHTAQPLPSRTMTTAAAPVDSQQTHEAMRLRGVLSLPLLALLGSAASMVAAQDLTSSHNATSLYGTWSSGSGNVMTGMGFANPVNYSFIYPKTSGISYSFTDDGFFEEAQYRFTANASLPNCITAIVLWQHGTYTLGSNGSLVLNPWAADGRIQVQDPCAAVTNIITLYDQQVLYAGWGIQVDTIKGVQTLQLNRFDGALMPPLYLVAQPPNMLPTTQLSGHIGNDTTLTKRGLFAEKRSAAAPSAAAFHWSLGAAGALAIAGLGLVL